MWAIILSNKVVELTNIDPEGRYHPSFAILEAPIHAKVGMTYENGSFFFSQEPKEVLECQERAWRNSELIRADIELNKVQDSDSNAKGTVSDWRNYRKALRNYPENPSFPDTSVRPPAPDTSI